MNNPERNSQSADLKIATARKSLKGLHILVVDDSASILILVEQMLLSEGAHCSLANSAQQAFDVLKGSHEPIDAVLMDIQMPVANGLYAIREIRREPRFASLPLIAMTAGILEDQQESVRAAGGTDTLHKPIRIDALVQCISKWTHIRSEQKINYEHASKTIGPNKATIQRLLRLFLQEHINTVANARKDLAMRNIKPAARRMHTLRGGAGQLGALDLQHAAHVAEQAILTSDPSINARLSEVDQELHLLQSWS